MTDTDRELLSLSSISFARDADGMPVEGRVLGSLGRVLRAEMRGRPVEALLLPLAAPRDQEELLTEEERRLADPALSHTHLARILGLAVSPTRHAVLAEHCATDLNAVLQAALRSTDGHHIALPVPWRLQAISQLVSGLGHLHTKGIAHNHLTVWSVLFESPHVLKVSLLEITAGLLLSRRTMSSSSSSSASSPRGGRFSDSFLVRWAAPEALLALQVPPPPPLSHKSGDATPSSPTTGSRMAASKPQPAGPPPLFSKDVYATGLLMLHIGFCMPDLYPGLSDLSVFDGVVRGTLVPSPLRSSDLHAGGLSKSLVHAITVSLSRQATDRPKSATELFSLINGSTQPPGRAGPGAAAAAAAAAAIARSSPRVPAPPLFADLIAADPTGTSPASGNTESVQNLVSLDVCMICMTENVEGIAFRCLRDPSHVSCCTCALRHIRAELTPTSTMVRCPFCLPLHNSPVAREAVEAIAAWSRTERHQPATDDVPTSQLRCLSDEQMATFERIMAGMAVQAEQDRLVAEKRFKKCPACQTGVIRPRGHHCHHISPGGGCSNCGTHFCYACLHVYADGESTSECPSGCPLFCNDTCDCPDCTECSPGHPCDDCTGSTNGTCWSCCPENRPENRVPGQEPSYPPSEDELLFELHRALMYIGDHGPGVEVEEEGEEGEEGEEEEESEDLEEWIRNGGSMLHFAASTWACHRCTLVNLRSRRSCDACRTRRPPIPELIQRQGRGAAASDGIELEPQSSHLTIAAAATTAATTAATRVSASQPVASGGAARLLVPAPSRGSNWNCDVCSRENSGELLFCEACSTPYTTVASEFPEHLPMGMEVTRGPTWRYADEDGGRGSIGLVSGPLDADSWIKVTWRSGSSNTYLYKPKDGHVEVLPRIRSTRMTAADVRGMRRGESGGPPTLALGQIVSAGSLADPRLCLSSRNSKLLGLVIRLQRELELVTVFCLRTREKSVYDMCDLSTLVGTDVCLSRSASLLNGCLGDNPLTSRRGFVAVEELEQVLVCCGETRTATWYARGDIQVAVGPSRRAPCNHVFQVGNCTVCPMCLSCTGFGKKCLFHNAPRAPYQPCGCGSGDGGCVDCGICRLCAAQDVSLHPGAAASSAHIVSPLPSKLLRGRVVTRGATWSSREDDGGQGSLGFVLETQSPLRDNVSVRWLRGGICEHLYNGVGSLDVVPVVLPRSLSVGTEVARGPSWEWGEQDGGVGCLGVVQESQPNSTWIKVCWQSTSRSFRYEYDPPADILHILPTQLLY